MEIVFSGYKNPWKTQLFFIHCTTIRIQQVTTSRKIKIDNNGRFVSKIPSISPTDITPNIEKREKKLNANTHEKQLPEFKKI